MSDRLSGPTVAGLVNEFEPALPFVTARAISALEQLQSAFEEGRALVVVDSGWTAGSNHLIERFLVSAGPETAVVKVSEAPQNAVEGLREIVRSIGIEPDGIADSKLEKVFVNFLGYRKNKNRRTVLVMEDTATNGSWVRELASRLVEREVADRYGLTVVLSRRTRFDGQIDESFIGMMSYQTATHISLTPFTPAETRNFVRWRIDADKNADIGQVLEYQAITLIHELCEGMPNSIDRLCCASLQLADAEDTAPVTTDIVIRASRALRLQPIVPQPVPKNRPKVDLPANIPTLKQDEPARIIVSYQGSVTCEMPLDKQRISIGRSEENDLMIGNKFVSRLHAAIFRNGSDTAVVDLDSTNGTYVNSRRVQVQTLHDQDEIAIGYHIIRFVDANAIPRVSLDSLVRSGAGIARNPKIASGAFVGTAKSKIANAPLLNKTAAKPD